MSTHSYVLLELVLTIINHLLFYRFSDMARKFIIRQNLSKMSNNLEKRDSLTTCESKSINNFGTLTNFALA